MNKVVVGANYGDEGKGLMTAFFANGAGLGPQSIPSRADAVVRYNGGAQAGHTVELPSGHRLVFSHFGAGTCHNVPTILSHHFMIDPLRFSVERHTVSNFDPVVFADPLAPVALPCDGLINRTIERHRGANRHGSVGAGYGEAVARTNSGASFTMSDLWNTTAEVLSQRMLDVSVDHVLAHTTLPSEYKSSSIGMLAEYHKSAAFIELLHECASQISPVDATMYRDGHLVMEGAQGLALHMDRGDFPHVTYSDTGASNAMALLRDNVHPTHVVYVTRPYITRHGAGPLQYEQPLPHVTRFHDATNVPNEFQGRLRLGLLDVNALAARIQKDVASLPWEPNQVTIAVTCCDQIDVGQYSYVCDGNMRVNATYADMFGDIARITGFDVSHASRGPCIHDVFDIA